MRTLILFGLLASITASAFELKDGDRALLLGDAFIEREQYEGWIEIAATTQFPDRAVTFRNLGWSADTPAGDSRNGLSLVPAGNEPTQDGLAAVAEPARHLQAERDDSRLRHGRVTVRQAVRRAIQDGSGTLDRNDSQSRRRRCSLPHSWLFVVNA